ncbi:MAG TPA: metalloregulator ArsR/SmtB family transcription factor [Candidatus Binataceae bacterium]|nr:metalloregulator ArsR/SmtB family transcription factor [Candidatus Binataceae bacterium]
MSASTANKVRHETPQMSWEVLQLVAERFRALGEPMRLRILQALQSGECGVSALAEKIGSTQPNVSKHLKVLQDVGLVKRRQAGTTAYYSIADEMVFELCEMVCSKLRDRLEAQVGALKRPAFKQRRRA